MSAAGLRYCRAASLTEAIELLDSEPGAVALAGGQSLLAVMALGRARPRVLVDLEALEGELGGIRVHGASLEIGALARQQDLLADPLIAEHAPLLADAARLVGNPQVRARGTVGGVLAHGDPPAELPTALAALDASVEVAGPAGTRTVGLEGAGAAVELGPAELITRVVVPIPGRAGASSRTGWGFEELAGRFAARPLVSAAAVAAAGDLRVAIGGLTAGPLVLELEAGEERDAAARIRERLEAVRTIADPRASERYRRHLAATLGERAARRAGERAAVSADERAAAPAGERAAAPAGERAAALRPLPVAAHFEVALRVNGEARRLSVPAGATLAEGLRDRLGLRATHLGCEHGVCGSCNVLVDGTAVRSCLMLAAQADGREVTTVEGLRDGGALDRLLPAFVDRQALQCGFCTPGMLVTLAALPGLPPDRRQLREQLVGNLCRCTGYRPVLESAEAAL